MTIEVTGYMIRTGIETATRHRDGLVSLFKNSTKKFSGEEKDDLKAISKNLEQAELNLVELQVIQDLYNQAVVVNNPSFGGDRFTLSQAIKMVGGLSRMEKIWKDAGETTDRIYGRHDQRVEGTEYATLAVPVKESTAISESFSKRKSTLSRLISEANGTKINMQVTDGLLE